MMITDEQISALEKALDIQLLDYQKEMIKKIATSDHVFIPRRNGYDCSVQMLAYIAMYVFSNEKEK